MRHRTKTNTYGQWIKLVKKTNPKTGRRHYSVIVDQYLLWGAYPNRVDTDRVQNFRTDIRAHFDPAGNRGMKGALTWKFTNREQAEQLITLALLKWGAGHVA